MKIKIPFVLSAGNNKSFKILTDEELKLDSELKNISLMSFFDSFMYKNQDQPKISKKSDYMKGSESKIYYENLRKK